MSGVKEVAFDSRSGGFGHFAPGGVVVGGFNRRSVTGDHFADRAKVVFGVVVILTVFLEALAEVVALHGGAGGVPSLGEGGANPKIAVVGLFDPVEFFHGTHTPIHAVIGK